MCIFKINYEMNLVRSCCFIRCGFKNFYDRKWLIIVLVFES